MKARWLLAAVAAVPFTVAVLALQSCGGEGGPIGGGNGGGGGGDTALVTQWKGLWTDSQKTNATYVGSDACGATGCHGNRSDSTIYETWHETKHFGENVGCESCHGPGSAHAASQQAADIMTFPKITDPVVCGQCHPQYNDWFASKHRQLIPSPVEEAGSNPTTYGRGSRCIACHSGLFRTEIYEKGVDAATLTDAQYLELSEETLNTVPYIATCATCHNPHAKAGNLNKEGEDVQLRHIVNNQSTTEINGNLVPAPTADTFTHFNQVCAQCHNGRAAGGTDAKLSSTSRPNMHDSNQFNMLMGVGGAEGSSGPPQRNMAHADAPGQCTTCHMPDARHTFTVSYDKGCAPCHTAADAAARKATLAAEMTQGLFALRTRMDNWAKATFTASTPGYTASEMDARLFPYLWEYSSNISTAATELGIDVNDATKMPPTTHQNAVPMALRRARHNYYFIVRDSSICPHNPVYARYLLDYANAQMDTLGGSRPEKAPPKLSFAQMQRILQADKARAAKSDLDALYNGDGG